MTTTTLASATAPPLVILVHLVSGQHYPFVQTDPGLARDLLAHLQPERLFAQPQLLIAHDRDLTTFACAAIEEIELIADAVPELPYHRHIVSAQEITGDEFQRYRRQINIDQSSTFSAFVFMEIELTSGRRVHLRLQVEAPPADAVIALDMRPMLQQFFASACLHARRDSDGGVLLINPAHIVRVLSHAPRAEKLPNTWDAQYIVVPPPEGV